MRPWPSIAAARAHDTAARARVAFHLADAAGASRRVGSVARAHLAALRAWPAELRIDEAGVTLAVPAARRDEVFAHMNARLREQGLIVAWRDETYPVTDLDNGATLATMERAASRFWGTLTFGAHCNGYVADASGRPRALWIARRAWNKATDPGALDNLIGGGVPHGQSPRETVLREGWEEAGLEPAQMQGLRAGRVLRLARDIPEGFQLEQLHVFDLALPEGLVPRNQDGEVAEIRCMDIAQACEVAAGEEMTVDASLVTLDFALRHELLAPAQSGALAQAAAHLWVEG